MKKMFSFLLALTLILSLTTTAFAATLDNSGETDTADVTATYVAGQSGSTVYSVDVAWEGLTFTYNGATTGTWDPATHTYSGSMEAGWASNSGTITITNHSNAAITATASYAAKTGYEAVGMTFGNNEAQIASADNQEGENGAGVAKSVQITVTPNGNLPETAATATVIGTITVTIQ